MTVHHGQVFLAFFFLAFCGGWSYDVLTTGPAFSDSGLVIKVESDRGLGLEYSSFSSISMALAETFFIIKNGNVHNIAADLGCLLYGNESLRQLGCVGGGEV